VEHLGHGSRSGGVWTASLAEELDAHGEGRVAGRRRVRAPEDRRAVAWSCWL
jgi:hypothetical protein